MMNTPARLCALTGLALAPLSPLHAAPHPGRAAVRVPAAVVSDPPRDVAHPARMEVLHIPSGGVEINGVAYLASGAGPHPTVIVCHGFPGNEKNLDLAQALRRAGWNAITFNYRGSWGSAGTFRFAQNPQDLRAVLAFLRDPAHAGPLGIDTRHLAVVGHSMGGWVTAMGADSDLAGLVLISAADFGMLGRMDHAPLVKFMSENMETLAGTSPEALAGELNAHPADYDYAARGPALVSTPLLVLTSDDGLAPHGKVLVEAVRKAGGKRVQTAHVATDHSWSDRRIELEARVINFLSPLLR